MDQSEFDLASLHSAASGEDQTFGGRAEDWFLKGIPAALGSGLISMYNTGAALGNVLGADIEEVDISGALTAFDDNLGAYYDNHKQGADLGGFVLTSLAPGMVGIKALKMLQGGEAGLNASRITGALKTTTNPLNYFKNQEAKFTKLSVDKIRNSANEVFDAVDRDKIAAIAFGAGDQVLQGAAFETAVLLTMNQSPVLSEEDESYFTSFMANSSSIVTAGALQGLVGGVFKGLSLSGALKKAVVDRDISQLPSVLRKYTPESIIDPGTRIVADYSYWTDSLKEFARRKELGELTDGDILNYQRTLKNQELYIQKKIKDDLIPDNDDAAVGIGLWDLIKKADNSEEVANMVLAAAKKIERVGTASEPPSNLGPRILFGEEVLVGRKANNIIDYAMRTGKLYPEMLDRPTGEQLVEVKSMGSVLWRDVEGIFHVVEDSDYAKKVLPRSIQKKDPALIVNLKTGEVTETAYATAGDLGKVSIGENGELLINKAEQIIPEKFDPLVNDTLDSHLQFVHRSLQDLKKMAGEFEGTLSIPKGDLPLLEAVAKSGFEGEVFYAGTYADEALVDILHGAKIDLRQQLIEAGHDFRRIARELNTSQEWAETGRGPGFLLKDADFTKPEHALISYDTTLVPPKHLIRGTADLTALVKLGIDTHQKAAAKILKEDYALLPSTNGTLFKVTTIPDFANLIKSSSEDYGSFGSMMQQAGKVVNTVIRKRAQAVFQALQANEFQLKASKDGLAELNIVVNKFRSGKEPYYLYDEGAQPLFVPKSIYKKLEKATDEEEISDLLTDERIFSIKNKDVESYILMNQDLNRSRVDEFNTIFAAKGLSKTYDPQRIYVPPLDTNKYSYVAFVKEKMDMGVGDLKEAGVITAPSEELLAKKVNQVRAAYGDRFEVVTTSDIKLYKEIKGEWETGPLLGDSLTDQAMRNEGLLYEFQPRVDAEIINDFNNWHWRQENNVVRQTVELKYAQEFAELRGLARQFEEYASKFGPKNTYGSKVKNPYHQYIKAGLDISNFDRYNSLWGKFNDVTEGVGSKMIGAWKHAFSQAVSGEMDWVKANAIASSYGFTPPYTKVISSIVQPVIENSRALEPAVAKINGAISTITLGLDFLHSLVNVISFPVMATSEMHNVLRHIKDPSLVGELSKLTSVVMPGSGGMAMPTPMKLLTSSIARLTKDDGSLLSYYKAIGAVRDPRALGFDVISASAMTPDAISSLNRFSTFANTLVEKAADYGKTFTGHNKAEEWVRFMAADMMKQLTDVAKIPASDAPAYINSFVNRVHGNYLANQRPHLFQGVVGQAISLFQTYQFNLMQNMIRYVGQGDKTAAAVLLGMQNTIFGMQGSPAFYKLNEAIGMTNREHLDITSGLYLTTGPEMAQWMIYGLGANATQTSLYNRGDLTPRQLTVVPTQLEDIPAVAIPLKAITSFINTASNIVKGGDVSASLLDGLAHLGANRPLAGLAQLTQGFRTTTKGSLLTAYNDLDAITVAAKLAGGEELNRAIATDAYYRNLAYQAADRERLRDLGRAVKTTLYAGGEPDEDQVVSFMERYTRAGGTPKGFNRWMNEMGKSATQSQMNLLKSKVNSRAGRLQATMMGADTEDFYFNPPEGDQ